MGMRLAMVIGVACAMCFFAHAALAHAGGVHFTLAGENQPSIERTLNLLQRKVEEEGETDEIFCLLAEAHFYYGDWFSGEEQIQIWRQGEQYARRALELNSHSADAHYWVAATLGKMGRAQGILKSLFLVNPMFEHLGAALEIDREHSWAHYALSHLYLELPPKPLGRGDRTRALSYAGRAFELEPEEPEFVLQYARLLLKENHVEEARSLLLAALDDPTVRWTEPLFGEAGRLARLPGDEN